MYKILPYIPIIGILYFAYQLLAKDKNVVKNDKLFIWVQFCSVLFWTLISKTIIKWKLAHTIR
jgi:hypothetical protein